MGADGRAHPIPTLRRLAPRAGAFAWPRGPGFPGRLKDPGERILRIWPLAAIIVYLFLDRSFIYHLFEGLSIPLGILAVRGLNAIGARRAALAAVTAVMVVPGNVYVAATFAQTVTAGQDFYVDKHTADAMQFLALDRVNGVSWPAHPWGKDVPGFSGRGTWVGNYEWTPDFRIAWQPPMRRWGPTGSVARPGP